MGNNAGNNAAAAGGGEPEIEVVSRGGGDEYNWTRPDGTYVLKDWAYGVRPFSGGWGCFQRKEDEKYNFADADGNLLSDEWFDDASPFGYAEGDPASAKVGGRWHALYGRRADGAPDLSEGWIEASDVSRFYCGLAVVSSRGAGGGSVMYGYVDASMGTVGPGKFPFYGATRFGPDIYGGRWAKVTLAGGAGAAGLNLMGLDGGLAFGGSVDCLPASLTRKRVGRRGSLLVGRRGSLIASPNADSNAGWYRFPASEDWSEIGRIGICKRGGAAFLDGTEGRLTLRMAWDRVTGRVSECIVARDTGGMEHAVCLLDGRGPMRGNSE